MAVNPDTNKIEILGTDRAFAKLNEDHIQRMSERANPFQLLRPNGEPVPPHWPVFTVGELVVIKDYTFKVAYIGETAVLFEPVSALEVQPDATE